MPARPARRQPPLPIREGLNATRVRVPPQAAGMSAGVFVGTLVATQAHPHPADGPAAVAARFAAGEVVDGAGRQLDPDLPLAPGTDVWFYRMPAPEPPVPGDLAILHRDENLVVTDKPPFLATTPRGRHITETATVRLRRATGNPELVPAHRLDRLTSGLLVFTARAEVRGAYQDLFAARQVTKRYQAIAPLVDLDCPVVLEHRMEKVRGVLQARVVPGEPNARTVVEAVEPLGVTDQDGRPLARWLLRPTTGRTHQLRLHLHHLGAPMLGDPLYPRVLAEGTEDLTRPLALLATELAFTDPLTGADRLFQTSLQLPTPTPAAPGHR